MSDHAEMLADALDEQTWDASFAKSHNKLVAAAKKAGEEIARGLATPLDLDPGKKGTGPICAKHPPGRSGNLDLSPFSLPISLNWRRRLWTIEKEKTHGQAD